MRARYCWTRPEVVISRRSSAAWMSAIVASSTPNADAPLLGVWAAGAAHPYLGPAFEFLPRTDNGAEFLRNIHCFNLAGALSFGIPVGDVPSVVDQPRLANAIARDLYVEGVDVAAHERFVNAPLTVPNPAPYERAVATRGRAAA